MSEVDATKETGSPITAQLGAAPGDLIHLRRAVWPRCEVSLSLL